MRRESAFDLERSLEPKGFDIPSQFNLKLISSIYKRGYRSRH